MAALAPAGGALIQAVHRRAGIPVSFADRGGQALRGVKGFEVGTELCSRCGGGESIEGNEILLCDGLAAENPTISGVARPRVGA